MGNRKGGSYERSISKFLTEWASGQRNDYWFWRTPGSGAVATVTGYNDNISGDIMPIRPEGAFMNVFSIECKNGYGSASFEKHIKENKGNPLQSFWVQACKDAKKGNKEPMLIFNKLRSGQWIALSESAYEKLKDLVGDLRYVAMFWPTDEELDLPVAIFMDMPKFFERVTPEHIKERFPV